MPFVPLTADTGDASSSNQSFDSNYNTKLSPTDEMQFRGWKAKYAPKDSGEDYDLRGAFKAGLTPDPKTGHWPDTFKKPNHPTFSDQSKYADYGKPGSWDGDKFVPPSIGKTGFTPLNTPLEYKTSPIVERAKYVAGAVPGAVETTIGGMADFGGTIAAGIGGIAYGALPAMHEGQKINWSDPNNPFYQEYAKEQKLWSENVSPVLAPQTEVGKDIMGGFGTVAEKMRKMGEKVTDITGSEAAGAWTEAGLQTLGIPLGMKALGVIPMAGGGVAALLAKGKRAAGAPSGAPTAEGPRAPIPGEASVADQLKSIRPVPPEAAPTPEAAPQGFTPEPPKGPTPEESAQMAKDAAAYRKLQEDLKAGAPPPEEQPIAPPPGAATFMPKPGDVPTAPRHASPGLPVQEVQLAGLKLSEDVPQFKKEANAQGVVVPLGGKFDRVGVAPIQIWERLNGDHEIISGRHRFDLAKRSGEETIPGQIHREADGFTKDHAAVLDAELNIRDEQGGVNDYANYFRTTGLDEETAKSRGLLARAKGRAGYAIANQASDEVFAAHGAGIISDEAALAFSRAAPKDGAAQAVGLKMLNEGRSISQAENTIRAIAMMQKNGEAKPEQGDIFGFDDSAIRQAEEMAKKASAAQRAIREQLAAVSGATKRPEVARKLGVDVKDPEAVKAKIIELHSALDRLANWPLYPDLVREFRGEEPLELKGETEAEIQAKEAAKAKAAEESRKKESAPPPEDFVMTGSTRPADEAAARGQNDMFGNTPLKPEEGKGILDAVVQGMRRKAGERRAVEGRPLEGLAEDRRVAAAMQRREEASTKGEKEPWQMTREKVVWEGYVPDGSDTERALAGRLARWEKIKREANGVNIESVDKAIAKEKARIERANSHRAAVAQAIRDGKPVPSEVLADYPDLQPTKGNTDEKTTKAKPTEKKQPQEPAKPVAKEAPRADLKPQIETLIKRKRFADEIHLGRKLDSAIDKAKTAMETGEGKPSDFVKYAKWFRDKDAVTQKALLDIADTLKGGAKAAPKEATKRIVEITKTGKNVVKQDAKTYGSNTELADALAKYEDTGEFMSVNDLVNDVDRLIGEDLAPDSLQEAIDDYHREQADDYEYAGRGDMGAADENFIAAVRAALPKNEVQQSLVPYSVIDSAASYYGTPGARALAKLVKEEDPAAVRQMAEEMAPFVPDDAVLIPVPSRGGRATFTKVLADKLAELTGAKVADVLVGKKRESLYDIKRRGGRVNAEMLGLRLKGEIPSGNPVFVDNVLATGTTASAAMDLVPGARVLVHSIADRGEMAKYNINQEEPAYHGSPFTFGKFTLDHMGKGEGAQAYGHGLYFAGSKSVAEFYKQALSNKAIFLDGKKIGTADLKSHAERIKIAKKLGYADNKETPNIVEDVQSLLRMLDFYNGDWNKVRESSSELLDTYRDRDFAIIDDLKDRVTVKAKGKLYSVELAPSQEEYLNWDKPLSEQSKHVQDALRKHSGQLDQYEQDYMDRALSDDRTVGGAIYKAVAGLRDDQGYGTTAENPAMKFASEFLHSIGIRGIKYLDAGSRSKGEGSSNYVVFSDADVNIKSVEQQRAQYDLFPEQTAKQAEVGMPKPKAEPVTPKQEVKAAREIKLEQNEATPGIYYVTAKLEKVGERDLPAKVTTWQEAANATAYLSKFAVEHFDMIVTDKKGQPLAVIGSFKGAVAQASVYPATIAQELAKIKGAAHVWASHNHPFGTAELSQADRMLSENIGSLLVGSGVAYHGIMAVGGDRWTSDSMEFERGEISKLPTEMVKAPIVERVTEGSPNEMMSLSSPRDSRTIVPNLAKDKPGIVFLSTQHNPVAFVPLDPEAIFPLRQDGRLMKLFNSAASTGAGAAIIANPNDVMSMRDMNNLGAALGSIDIRAIDAISYDPENIATTAKSKADTGLWMPSSSIVQQTHGVYEVNDAARDMQVHRLQDKFKYSREEALHDFMTGKRVPSPDYELFGGGKDDVHQIINFNIGITPKDLAKGAGQIAKDAKAVMERAKATKLGAAASEWMDAVKSDLQTKVVPMAAGTDRARAIAKDFANADRMSRWQWEKFDSTLKKSYTKEQREKMWSAAEDENQIRIEKLPEDQRKGRGLDRLTPEERATMDTLHQYGEDLLQRARDVGLFKGEGVEYWSPRVVAMIGEDGTISMPKDKGGGQGFTPYSSPTGGNISTKAGSLKARKHETVAGTEAAAKARFGEGAAVVKDIRTMPMAMARIERAIATRELIDQIKSVGEQTGQELVLNKQMEGFFTIDHPAFKTYRYRPDVVQKEAFDRLMMDQLNQFATDIGVVHQRVAKMGGNRWGVAYMGGDEIKSRFGGPESVITHEIGHQLDHKYGLAKKFVNAKDTKKELRALADLRYEGAEDQVSNHYKKYVREGSEKIANMVHAYVHLPERFKQVAPNSYAEFTSFLKDHPELNGLNKIKPSLRLGTGSISKRPPGEDFDVFPVYVSKEFEGPLKSIMTDKPGNVYQAFMSLKGKSMSVIMYSPLIHNGVEWGRALPLMPGRIITFKAYFDGNMAKNNPAVMRELINDGMVPIGHRFFMQDISGIMEEPELQPGRSWTAKIAGGAVGLANKKAGEAVKKGIDTAGDFWHNTLLWDRIGDLQAGIAVNVKADLIKKGMDPQTAGRVSAHLANRFAGALPNEAMSANARKVANFMFFSRTFSLGNLGVMKDMISGLPRDVQAQILRDAGEASAFAAKGAAQKAAIKSVSIDIALMYGANAALQSGFDAIKRDKSLDDIEREYVERFDAMIKNVKEDPSNLLKPFGMLESLTPMSANEPGKEQRVLYDYDKTGTAIYVRLPTGKIGEEFLTWATSPLDILKRKEGTVARPLIQTLTNDRGFGRKVYDENLPGYKGAFKAVGNIAWNMLSQQFPVDSLNSALDIARHQSDETDATKVIGPLFGLTFSKGAPGGPEVGMMYTVERMHRAEISDAMPDIKRYIKQGNMEDAVKRMYDAHFTPQEIRATIKFSMMPRARLTPQAMKKFYETSTPEQKQKMQDIQKSAP